MCFEIRGGIGFVVIYDSRDFLSSSHEGEYFPPALCGPLRPTAKGRRLQRLRFSMRPAGVGENRGVLRASLMHTIN